MTNLISETDDAIDTAARLLALDADSGYTDGYERELAREVYDGIPEAGQGEVLHWLIDGPWRGPAERRRAVPRHGAGRGGAVLAAAAPGRRVVAANRCAHASLTA